MAIETACRCLDVLNVATVQTLLVDGAGTVIGFAAVQMALIRGARVIAAAGETFAGQLRALEVKVTPYGEGMVERVLEIALGTPDLVFHAGPISGELPDLIRIACGNAGRVLTVSNHGPAAETLGVHSSFESGLRYDALAHFAKIAAEADSMCRLRAPSRSKIGAKRLTSARGAASAASWCCCRAATLLRPKTVRCECL